MISAISYSDNNLGNKTYKELKTVLILNIRTCSNFCPPPPRTSFSKLILFSVSTYRQVQLPST